MSTITLSSSRYRRRLVVPLLATLLFFLPAGCAPENAATETPTVAIPSPIPATVTAPAATAQPLPPPPEIDPDASPPLVTHDLPYLLPRRSTVLPQSLDVYTPGARQPAGWPVVIMAHGTQQHKEDFRLISEKLAAQGTVVFTVDWPTYSISDLRDGDQVREMSEALICAVRYAHTYAPLFGGDPDRLIMAGFSSGASVGGLVAVGGTVLEAAWADIALSNGAPADPLDCAAPDGDARVAAFVGIGGPYVAYDELRASDPALWAVVSSDGQLGVNPDLVVRLLHGRSDSRVPQAAAERFESVLIAAGYRATLTIYEDGHKVPHDLTLATIAEIDALLQTE